MTAEHEFGKYKTQGDWDRVVFDNAVEFTVFVPNVGKWSFKTFADAVLHALSPEARGRSLVYAITASERSTCVPKEQWSDLLQGRMSRPRPKNLPCEICGKTRGTVLIGERTVHASCWRTERLK